MVANSEFHIAAAAESAYGYAMNGDFRFSLRQVFLAVSVLGVCVAAGQWCNITFFDRVHFLTPEDPFAQANMLDFHIGNRLALRGRYEHIGSDSYQFTGSDSLRNILWFGSQPIAIVGVSTDVLRTFDDASIMVQGRLVNAPPDCSFLIPIERTSNVETHQVYPVLYYIKAEEVKAAREKMPDRQDIWNGGNHILRELLEE